MRYKQDTLFITPTQRQNLYNYEDMLGHEDEFLQDSSSGFRRSIKDLFTLFNQSVKQEYQGIVDAYKAKISEHRKQVREEKKKKLEEERALKKQKKAEEQLARKQQKELEQKAAKQSEAQGEQPPETE